MLLHQDTIGIKNNDLCTKKIYLTYKYIYQKNFQKETAFVMDNCVAFVNISKEWKLYIANRFFEELMLYAYCKDRKTEI